MNRFTHIIVVLVVAYWIVAVSIHFGLVFWSPQPTIDRMEAVDSTQVSRTLIDFFEHTPRVNAVIALEAEGGSPTSILNSDRVRYGIGQLLCLAAMIVDLLDRRSEPHRGLSGRLRRTKSHDKATPLRFSRDRG